MLDHAHISPYTKDEQLRSVLEARNAITHPLSNSLRTSFSFTTLVLIPPQHPLGPTDPSFYLAPQSQSISTRASASWARASLTSAPSVPIDRHEVGIGAYFVLRDSLGIVGRTKDEQHWVVASQTLMGMHCGGTSVGAGY